MGVLLAVSGGFASGIFVRSFVVLGWPLIALTFLAAALCAAAYRTRPFRGLLLASIFLAAFTLGAIRFAVADTHVPQSFVQEVGKRVSYEGVVVGAADVRDANARTPIRITSGTASVTMLVVTPRTEVAPVGTRVHVSGTLEIPAPFQGDNGRTFRYDRYLQKDGIRFILSFAYLAPTRAAPWYSLPALLGRIRDAYGRGLDNALPEPYASLARGVTLGGKSGLGTALKDAFTRTGIVQIIVLSGYHVMLVATAVLALLGSAHEHKKRGALIAGAIITLFVALAGAGSAALRALVMALIALFAKATGRSYAAGRALLFAIICLLLWNPFLLAFDPGFALSVAATAGLIWLAPVIEPTLARVPSAYLRNAIAITFSAQLAVLPLLLYFMGTLSFVAIPANLLIMPVVPFAMLFAACAGVAGVLFGMSAAAYALALPAYAATAYLIMVAQKSAALPWAALSVPPFSFLYVVLAYGLLIYLVASSKRFSTTLQFRFSKNAST